jgi:hypothetical protein
MYSELEQQKKIKHIFMRMFIMYAIFIVLYGIKKAGMGTYKWNKICTKNSDGEYCHRQVLKENSYMYPQTRLHWKSLLPDNREFYHEGNVVLMGRVA